MSRWSCADISIRAVLVFPLKVQSDVADFNEASDVLLKCMCVCVCFPGVGTWWRWGVLGTRRSLRVRSVRWSWKREASSRREGPSTVPSATITDTLRTAPSAKRRSQG